MTLLAVGATPQHFTFARVGASDEGTVKGRGSETSAGAEDALSPTAQKLPQLRRSFGPLAETPASPLEPEREFKSVVLARWFWPSVAAQLEVELPRMPI